MTDNAKLPTWDEMTDLDKGAALLHLWKCENEGTEYATEEYPAEYFDDPALIALNDEAASEHAQRLFDNADVAWSRLGPNEYDRLYELALDADRKRCQDTLAAVEAGQASAGTEVSR
jgi:hypothetical protein